MGKKKKSDVAKNVSKLYFTVRGLCMVVSLLTMTQQNQKKLVKELKRL